MDFSGLFFMLFVDAFSVGVQAQSRKIENTVVYLSI
jgi:hypothetical protein